MDPNYLPRLLEKALADRQALLDADAGHRGALRLFNGFLEGCPDLLVDLYASTLVLYNHADPPEDGRAQVQQAHTWFVERLPWLRSGILKTRNSPTLAERRGQLLFGVPPDRKVLEDGIWYALDLSLHQDAGLYLDTRLVRTWARQNLAGCTVLNTFAYTGSLGLAALAGGASHVVQTDLKRQFLDLARSSCALNGFPIEKSDFMVGDFWAVVGRLKRSAARFDCVFVDPPFFSVTPKGRLDLNVDSIRLINKLRPLINDGGWLVSINNAVYVSGADYLRSLEQLCADGYLKLATLIPVPPDCAGYPDTDTGTPVTDPAPFNHSTKIAVLEVRRK